MSAPLLGSKFHDSVTEVTKPRRSVEGSLMRKKIPAGMGLPSRRGLCVVL